ncbi:MAG: adenosylcobinamide-GDP ribazoletransferase [Leptospirales bacterium]
MSNVLLALTTLTAIRFPILKNCIPGRSVRYFPLAGVLIGGIFWALYYALSYASYVPGLHLPELTAFIILVLYAFLTGGLHFDGLADWADAHFAGKDKTRTLEILKDTHMGAFGVVALIILLLGKWILYKTWILNGSFALIFISFVVSRLGASYACAMYSSVRKNGTGTEFIEKAKPTDFIIALTLALLAGFAAAGIVGLGLIVLSMILIPLVAVYISNKIGGMTGDLLGAQIELTELLFLLLTLFIPFENIFIWLG